MMTQKMTRREDYLKLIHRLSARGEVRGADLADALAIKRPTVCIYLKRLVENGDITMDAHHRVSLTEQGGPLQRKRSASTACCFPCCWSWASPGKLPQRMPAPSSITSALKPIPH